MRQNVIVWGAGGFVGGELLRLICCHPHFQLKAAVSETHADKKIAAVYPQLSPFTDITFTSIKHSPIESLLDHDTIVFSAMPHKETMKLLPTLIDTSDNSEVKFVDLSGDFRLKTKAIYEAYYKTEHLAPAYLERFVYGLPEIQRDKIRAARYVSNPGCFATAAQLALLPLASLGGAIRAIAIDGKTGSSGAGATPRATTHHPNRMNNFRAYKQLAHQHTPEIVSTWQQLGGTQDTPISFVPQMAPMVRGIFITAHFFLENTIPAEEASERYRSFYETAPFVRLVEGSPSVAEVWGTNRCDISVNTSGKMIVVCAAIDNLVKGAAGQALQNANLMADLDETAGLQFPAPAPV